MPIASVGMVLLDGELASGVLEPALSRALREDHGRNREATGRRWQTHRMVCTCSFFGLGVFAGARSVLAGVLWRARSEAFGVLAGACTVFAVACGVRGPRPAASSRGPAACWRE